MTLLDRFRKIEENFNKNYLVFLWQLKETVSCAEDASDKDREQYGLLEDLYTVWFEKLQENTKCTDGCKSYHDAVDHNLLLNRDETFFTVRGDFLCSAYNGSNIDTLYLYNQLSDGSEGDEDSKANFWTALTDLFRLSVLICIYLKMPLVKEIIDIIMMNTNIHQGNIFESIFNDFKSKKQLRRLIMKLLKSKEENFTDIFDCLQKVISTFGNSTPAQDSKHVHETFSSILEEEQLDGSLFSSDLLAALNTQTDTSKFVRDGHVSEQQLRNIEAKYHAKGLDKINTNSTVGKLGDTMKKMMECFQTGNEEEIKQIIKNTGSDINLDESGLAEIQKELEEFDFQEEESKEESYIG